ncbi:LADA_0G02212g1_1 [Lachancea dasiensis]|uniref:Mediator of RNA polymerase II transcription subunit 7 n=1 Tax=Lachancea dasiensis TaxID=1072105 RepID=A0A1G4JR36_9SACH|nr:LADA_0G02212g1_1 [Lachancea dasiensis]
MSKNASNEITALYPPPPPYIEHFTAENLHKLQELEKAGRGAESLDDGLKYLVPPDVPTEGHYRAFGSVWQVKDELPDLKSMGMTQLYLPKADTDGSKSSYQDKIQELHKLLQSLLLNFLELTGILSVNPEQFPAKVDHIQTILVNFHHLLNEYRPHQSRESLIMLLEEQLEYKRKEISKIEQVCQEVKEKLANLIDGGDKYEDSTLSQSKRPDAGDVEMADAVDVTEEHPTDGAQEDGNHA